MPITDLPALRCPMGCGATLHLMPVGVIRCLARKCPEPMAASMILADEETEHVVVYKGGTYVVRHPLRERIGDALVECELAAAVFCLSDHPQQDGRYRMWFDEDDRLARKLLDG